MDSNIEKEFIKKFGEEELIKLKEYKKDKNNRIDALIDKFNSPEIKKQVKEKIIKFLEWDYAQKDLMLIKHNIELDVKYNVNKKESNFEDEKIFYIDGGLIGDFLPDNMKGLFNRINIVFSNVSVNTKEDSICSGSDGCLLDRPIDYHKKESRMFVYTRLELIIEFSNKFPVGKTLIGGIPINRTSESLPLIDIFLWENSNEVLVEPHLEKDYYKIPIPQETKEKEEWEK